MKNNSNKQPERCKCGIPMVKRLDSRKLEFLKFHKGEPVKFLMGYSGDKFDMHCEKCGRTITFMTSGIQLGMTYEIAPLKAKSI